jgi:hypothetical protein
MGAYDLTSARAGYKGLACAERSLCCRELARVDRREAGLYDAFSKRAMVLSERADSLDKLAENEG